MAGLRRRYCTSGPAAPRPCPHPARTGRRPRRAIVAGLISPEEGAELIWHISTSLGDPEELNALLDEATDWAYAWGLDEEESRQEIIEHARELLVVMTLDTLDKQPGPDRMMTLDDEGSTPCTQT